MKPQPTIASPSALAVSKAAAVATVADDLGRTITLRKPGVLAECRVLELLGESARNDTYLAMVRPLLYVAAIDREPVPPMESKADVENLIERLDEHGVSAAMRGVEEHFGQYDATETKEAVRQLAQAAPMRECLFLIKNGIPFDVAFALDDVTRTAWSITFSEFNGNKFDWSRMDWVKE